MRKFRLRKILAAAGALLLGFNIFLAQAEAKSSFWSSLEKVITTTSRGSHSSSGGTSRNKECIIKRGEMPLDGSYVQVATSQKIDLNTTVAVHYFTLDKPAQINWHVIGYSEKAIQHTIYDADGNKLLSIAANNGHTKDGQCVLAPGRYVIKSATTHIISSPGFDFEMKMTKEDISTNVSAQAYRRTEAPILSPYVTLYDYIPQIYYKMANINKYVYYGFDVTEEREVSLAMERLSNNLQFEFALIDADENIINRWDGIYDVTMVKKFLLKPGRYYIRLNRKNDSGGAYAITLK